MGIEWYRDLSIAVMGLMSIITLVVIMVLVLAAYMRLNKLMSKMKDLQQKIEDMTEKRLAGYRIAPAVAYAGMLIGSVIRSFRPKKTKADNSR